MLLRIQEFDAEVRCEWCPWLVLVPETDDEGLALKQFASRAEDVRVDNGPDLGSIRLRLASSGNYRR
ncbi:MAG TPA: hypothetical protein VMY35_12850 [Phycisphaerae bacterium]|nr:hypothetical protein [Phycisphaerae bacterium]